MTPRENIDWRELALWLLDCRANFQHDKVLL